MSFLKTKRVKPLYGFKMRGLIALSRAEVMGDPCHLFSDRLYDQWVEYALRHSQAWVPGQWHSTWFASVPLKVTFTLSDGLWWGCSIDTATVVRLLRSDWEILKGRS